MARWRVWRWLVVGLMLAGWGVSVSGAGSPARWHLCTQSADLGGRLDEIARRIALRALDDRPVVVHAVPHGEGSTEFLVASTTRLLDQLRERLQDFRVPHRRYRFELLSESEARPNGAWPARCPGVPVRIELGSVLP